MKIFIILVFLTSVAFAQKPMLEQCKVDSEAYCKGISSRDETLNCLLAHKKKLSKFCLTELERLSEILKSAGPRGSGGLSSFSGVLGSMGLAPSQKKIMSYSGSYSPEINPTPIQQHRLNLSSPLWTQGKESLATSLTVGQIKWNDPQMWKRQNFETPESLSRVEWGGQYSKKLNDSESIGLKGSLGSASDQVFASINEVTFSLNGTYAFPSQNGNYWILTAFMSNNNPLLNYVPIPGFIYLKKTSTFTGMFGLPFLSFQWTPTKEWIFSTSYFITNLTSEAAYSLSDSLQLFTGFAISQQTFLRADRSNIRDRLFFNEKKIYVGLKVPFGKMFSGDFQIGQSFDRKLEEGKRFNDIDMSADFGRSWYQSLNVTMMY